jgi:HEAT repeat protein
MKCQACVKAATIHMTEIVAGGAVEYHVCEKHAEELSQLKPGALAALAQEPYSGLMTLLNDPEVRKALKDPVAKEKMAAYQLPALCLALLDENPAVRIEAGFHLMYWGADAKAALGALKDALKDADERVRKVAAAAIQQIESGESPPFRSV